MITYLDLEIRNEDQLAADAIARVSGGLTSDIVSAQIETRRELLKLIEGGLDTPICPELTNANPGSPHIALIEAISWVSAQVANRFNKVSKQNLIAFANLFGIERRAASAAETLLRFAVSPPLNTAVTVPAGTDVSTEDGLYVFQTIDTLVIPYGTPNGTVTARRTVSGHTLLSPALLTKLVDNLAYVMSVTNPSAVDSGLDLEPLDETLSRVGRYQRRGERIVTAEDFEDALLDEGLAGNGIVRVFEKVENGDFAGEKKAGYVTAIVMTRTGDPVDSVTKSRCSALADQIVGNIFAYVVDPLYVTFDVTANVRLKSSTLAASVIALAERNLRNFYAADRAKFGRGIFVNDVVQVIESTPGVDHIPNGGLSLPAADMDLLEYQLAKLVNVSLTAV